VSASKSELVLVTGAAGFIGYHLSKALCGIGYRVIGIDNLNAYYDVGLKHSRLDNLRNGTNFSFQQLDLTDKKGIDDIFEAHPFSSVINLAAQAGVRYSLTNPYAYLESNLHGFLNILEACRYNKTAHLIFASSSSVYGSNKSMPFSESDNVDHPLALYAASKKANELMAHAYSNLYQLPTTGLRFFTIYGPWGRPDMAIFLFAKAIIEGTPIKLFNHGKMRRDFTHIDDVTRVVLRLVHRVPRDDGSAGRAPAQIYNVGNHHPEELTHVVALLEKELGRSAVKNMLPMQPGDVTETFADIRDLMRDVGFRPQTSIEDGIRDFVAWYRYHYKV